MSRPRPGLGKGLNALIPTAPPPPAEPVGGGPAAPNGIGQAAAAPDGVPESAPVAGAYFAELPTEKITVNPRQPRKHFDPEALKELADSIGIVGLLQPIVVRRKATEKYFEATGVTEKYDYELIMGERRLRASQKAGLDVIPAIVRDTDDNDLLRDALMENLHRQQLDPLEEAAAYGQLLKDFGATHEQLAVRIGRSRSHITNTLRLLNLPPAVQKRVAAGVLSAGHARALLSLDNPEDQERMAKRVVEEGISVRSLEELIKLRELDDDEPARRPRGKKPVAPGLQDLAERLSDRYDTRVRVDMGKNKGKIVVEFATLEDLDRIIKSMAPDQDAPDFS
ncbi:ParB/RepB/Spo0J family partition protein [Actinomadura algeriensis]|uniref:ParB family chromosome partitioning protein n=1 Tax=Actinomadura algeriensis TaxID=1679523 RepID=A0ABR9JPE5_9ACTN|nr:ParB/RepB/Spo0J family partition protein [Actinomadura algeriensis]MBE1532378.1 ParB family chromosome partitioning protein [Actinomadura algeriensis]